MLQNFKRLGVPHWCRILYIFQFLNNIQILQPFWEILQLPFLPRDVFLIFIIRTMAASMAMERSSSTRSWRLKAMEERFRRFQGKNLEKNLQSYANLMGILWIKKKRNQNASKKMKV